MLSISSSNLFRLTVIVSILGLFVYEGYSQGTDEWHWGNDANTAKKKNALYTKALDKAKYEKAVEPLEWLLINNPDLNPSIYINGVKIYEKLAFTTENEAYINRCLELFDLRVKYFNNEAAVLNRKAYHAYKLLRNRKERYGELITIQKKALEMNRSAFSDYNLVPLIDALRRNEAVGNDNANEEIVQVYRLIQEIINENESSTCPFPDQFIVSIKKMHEDL